MHAPPQSHSKPHPQFPHIFTPLQIRNVRLRNRIAVSAHFAGWWVDRGLPSDDFVAYLEERARGGVGLFVIGATSPEPGSGWLENISDDIIPRYRALVDAGHRHGTAVFAQLCHPGFRPLPGTPIIAPPPGAPSTQPVHPPAARYEPTVDDLQRLIRAFAAAAERAVRGGVDGMELHSHESFLHAQMLNPLWNTRRDEYGGSPENRMRFLIETLTAMRAATGDRPLGVRLKLDDMAQQGMTAAEYREVVQRLETLRLVDYLNVTGGDGRFHHGPMPRPEGEWLPLVRDLRAGTKLVLMHAGRISTPQVAEEALANGWLDVACMTKTHICDPHFTLKAFENRLDDIRLCTRCLQSCHGKMDAMTCVYNPLTSREAKWSQLPPATRRKRVIIVGAGPAGMECAITASARGHEVIVLERDARVGGQVWVGAGSPLRKPWARIAEFYARQAAKGVFDTRLNVNATADLIRSLRPDAVIIATGSIPLRLRLANGRETLTVHAVIAGRADNARHVVIYDREGFNRPLVAADYLSSRGIAVDLITPLPVVGDLVEGMMLEEMIGHLTARGVRFHPGHDLADQHDPSRVRLRNTQTAEERIIVGVDAIVATIGSTSQNTLAAELRAHVAELHIIGDANLPQTVEAAAFQGAHIARLL
jgi:2,4-dienoyl-CoA reductase-like NADH-dependent reductase (Old Yellow Enzyme family)/thioredoxin reductase